MKTRKAVIIVVEGYSDEVVFDVFSEYNRIHNSKAENRPLVFIISTGGDILTRVDDKHQWIMEYDCLEKLRFILEEKLDVLCKNKKFTAKDISAVLLVTDMDGVYINDSDIIEDKSLKDGKSEYLDTSIHTLFPWRIKSRNGRKRINIRYMRNIADILLNAGGEYSYIPLQMFYMSCNLDHVTVNNRNNRNKAKSAENWATDITGRENADMEIRKFFTSVMKSEPKYTKSWDYITKKNCSNSLERSSNCLLILDKFDSMSVQTGKGRK